MTISPTERALQALPALGWLLILHALADVLAGVYRCLDLDAARIDVLSAALVRSQVGLLAIWFALGREPWSWRLCGLVGGHCFLFSVLSGLALPGGWDPLAGSRWSVEQWVHYCRPSGAGDVLIKAPIIVPAVALPLLAWRLASGRRSRQESAARRWAWRFGFQDLAVWSLALSLVLAAVHHTPPYAGWGHQLLGHWRAIYRMQQAPAAYSVVSSGLYVAIAYLGLWTVYGRGRGTWRVPAAALLAIGAGAGFEFWLHRVAADARGWSLAPLWFQASAETAIATLVWLLTIASLALLRLYQRPSSRQGTTMASSVLRQRLTSMRSIGHGDRV